MIPYVEVPTIHLGPLPIEPFGILTASGVLLATWLVVRVAQKQRLPTEPLQDGALWTLLGGLVGGHLLHILAYHPEELHKSPLQILKMWDGLSSFGGLLGGVGVTLAWFWFKKIPLTPYLDAFALAIAPGWGIARLGCFAVHDHPGVRTTFPLAVNFPVEYYGGPRHDLGLYDALNLFTLALVLYVLWRRGALEGRRLAVLAILYGIVRFYLDTLRATDLSYVDKRYFGFTPAQYLCVALFLWGVAWIALWPRWGKPLLNRPVEAPAHESRARKASTR